ncbi:MAG: orotidine-5'-phosphate decarboxylase [Desulfurococcales archaeon]|nr:orotidine-5'-phosphate decarboxylase [Desulfurococcales archaeon]
MNPLPVIIGLDTYLGDTEKAARLAEETCSLVRGFKIGLPNLLANPNDWKRPRKACEPALLVADLKLADIGYTMKLVSSHVVEWADAVIAHAFPGVKGALDELKEYLDGLGKKLVLVVAMSNPGAQETMDPMLDKLVEIASRIGAWGIVAPATRPHLITRARQLYHGVVLAPGIGAQGAKPGTAIKAGADYEIIGRTITSSHNPLETLTRLATHYK